ncbi:TPA: hypothetical protein ACPPNY_001328 [Haemophilus influenzae]
MKPSDDYYYQLDAAYQRKVDWQAGYEIAFDKLWQLFGFELKQKIGGDWIYRLQRERNELAERLDKLKAYLDGMKECDPDRLKLLNKQVGAMDDYLDILNQRLAYV